MKIQKHSGAAHLVIVAILVLGLVGSLGYIVWDKFVNEKAPTKQDYVSNNLNSTDPVVDDRSDWKKYSSEEFGFSFRYPEYIKINNDADTQAYYAGNFISIYAERLDDINWDTMYLGKDYATKDIEALKNNDPSVMVGAGDKDSYKQINIDNALGKTYIIAQQLDLCNIQLSRRAVIYPNDSERININYFYNLSNLIKDNPSYFIESDECSSKIWRSSSDFVSDLMSGKTDKKTQEWYRTFDEIVNTLEIK